jgi:hypothetical protein
VNIRSALPALAGAALLSGTLAVHANAATARMAPVLDSYGTGQTTAYVALAPGEDCRYRVASALESYRPGDARPAVVWHAPWKSINGCLSDHQYSDGSILDAVVVRVPTFRLAPGRAYVVFELATRRWGGGWSVHAYARSLWHA